MICRSHLQTARSFRCDSSISIANNVFECITAPPLSPWSFDISFHRVPLGEIIPWSNETDWKCRYRSLTKRASALRNVACESIDNSRNEGRTTNFDTGQLKWDVVSDFRNFSCLSKQWRRLSGGLPQSHRNILDGTRDIKCSVSCINCPCLRCLCPA